MNITDIFTWESEVRDTELDFQGIVGNANYFIYMQHARHKHLKAVGIDVTGMHLRGFDLVLVHTEIDFKASLKSGDEFIVSSKIEMMGKIRFVIIQQVIRKSDQKIVVTAKNIGTCISCSSGRPVIPDELRIIFGM